MTSTTRLRAGDGRPLPRLNRMGLVAVLLGVAVACWVLTVALIGGTSSPGAMGNSSGMEGLNRPRTGLGGLGWFSLTWTVMMAAMMLPSLAPMTVAFARANAADAPRTRTRTTGATVVFVAAYLLSWSAAGVVGYLIVEGIHTLDTGFLAWNEAGRFLAGGVIVGAALYQMTGLKGVCLRHCRTPVMLARSWRSGRLGALRMGLEHGGLCIGNSWALMTVLVVLGLMSLGWMAFVTALVALEKLLPWKALAGRGIAVSLAVLGLTVAFAPAYVPGAGMPG